jgi:hypothetical protein
MKSVTFNGLGRLYAKACNLVTIKPYTEHVGHELFTGDSLTTRHMVRAAEQHLGDGRFHSNEEVEVAVCECLRMRKPCC